MPKIGLRAVNGQFVWPESGGNYELIANRNWIRGGEVFELIHVEKNKVALKASNGRYVRAKDGGGSELIADVTWIGRHETYTLLDRGDNKIALRAHSGKYVCAEGGGGQKLMANRDWIRSWETFELCDMESYRSTIIGLQVANGQYVCAEGGGGKELVANRNWLRSWEQFELIDLGGGQVALRARNCQYVCAEDGGNTKLMANRDWIRSWETFKLVSVGSTRVAFKAVNNKYVCAEGGGGRELIANRTWVRSWETFRVRIAQISGLYRDNATSAEEFRLDVDGRQSTQRASGRIFLNRILTIWWVADLTRTGTDVWIGNISFKHGATSNFAYTNVTIHVSRNGRVPTMRADFTGGGACTRRRDYTYRMPYFHDVEFEFDSAQNATPFTTYKTHSHPTRPAIPKETLTIAKVYDRSGFRVTKSGGDNKVPISLAGTNGTWSDAEMHDAMQKYWSHFADRPQWSMWVFWAALHDRGVGLGGVMYDDIGPNHRQGTAIFNNTFIANAPAGDSNPTAWVLRMRFWTAVHEMGHAFNLAHSWQKSIAFGNSWRPLANAPEARSFMNYPFRVAGGQSAFFLNFKFQFSTKELEFMRHAPSKFVKQGNADWFDDHGFQQQDPGRPSPLQLTLRANRKKASFEFMEPVVLELKLKNIADHRVDVSGNILEEHDHMKVIIKKDGKKARQYHPYSHNCYDPSTKTLKPGESFYESLFVSAGTNGWDLAEPGYYTMQIGLESGDGEPMIISNAMRLRIVPPTSRDEEFLAQDFFSEDVGRIISFDGSRYLTSGNDTLSEIADRLPNSKAAVHVRIAMAKSVSKEYKIIDFDKNKVTPQIADVAMARKYYSSAFDTQDAAETLGHVDYKYYADGYSDWLADIGEVETAMSAQDRLADVLKARKVLGSVVDECKTRRDSYKPKKKAKSKTAKKADSAGKSSKKS
jgi:hypothetical protein